MLAQDHDETALFRGDRSVVDQATGVLVLVYRTAPKAALQRLHEAARRHAVEPHDLAEAVVSVASGAVPPSPSLWELIDREWGELLL